MTKQFTITKEHLALLQRMNVEWDGECYNGAPAINLKRPYGNSSVLQDIAEILNIVQHSAVTFDGVVYDCSNNEDCDWLAMPTKLQDKLRVLHQETQTALQICLTTQSFEVGDYAADDYRQNWRKV